MITRGLDDVAALVSRRVAVLLVNAFPGVELYIPARLPERHELYAIGVEEARALSRVFGGSAVYVPKAMMGPEERRALILALARRGARRRDIALQAGCSVRRVFQILEEGDAGTRDSGEDDRQGDFFEDFRDFP